MEEALQLDLSGVCRCCLRTDPGVRVGLFDRYQDRILAEIVSDVSQLSFSSADGLPQLICGDCIAKFVIAFEIRQLCLKSDAYLKQAYLKPPSVPAPVQPTEMPLGDYRKRRKPKPKGSRPKNEEIKRARNEFLSNNRKEDRFFCLHCSKLFPNKTSYQRHKNYHKLAKTLCPICSRGFTHKSNLKRHLLLHKGEELCCDRCQRNFDDPAILYEHLKIHRQEEVDKDSVYMMTCEHCGQQTSSLVVYIKHMTEKHGVPREDVRAFVCSRCGLRFATKQGMFRHIDNIHENNRRNLRNRDRNFLCEDCGKCFQSSFHLRTHERVHTGLRPYECDYCHARFSQISGLKTHIFTHTGQKPFACNFCKKRFSQRGHVREHMLIHQDLRPYQCHICSHSFRVKGNLTAHLAIHSGVKRRKPAPKDDFSSDQSLEQIQL